MSLFDAARAAQLLQSRWENDPLRIWQPYPKQAMFLACKKPEAGLLGSNRSGKSDPLAALVSSLARFGNPNPLSSYAAGGRIEIIDRAVAIWVIGLTEKLIKEGIQPKIVTTAYTAAETHPAFIPPAEIDSWNINDQTWRLKNGSMIGFKSADAGRDVFQSASRDLVAFDEICEWEVYKEATFRVPGGNRRLMIRLAATLLPPLGMPGGVSWFYPTKIKPWWAKGNKENRPNGENPDPNLDIFSIGMRDNPYIHPDEILRLEEMFPDPNDPERRIRINGELLGAIGGTLAYTGFNHMIHVDNNVTPENLDPRYPLCLCVDFNVSPCVWVIGQRIEDTWYFFDEIKFDQCKITDMVEEFRRRYPTHTNRIRIYGDQTGAVRSVQTGTSHYYLISEGFKGYPVPVEQCLPTRNPFVADRLNAVNRAFVGADGRIGIVFGPLCRESIADCEEVLRDPKGGIKKTHHVDSPYWQRTHAMDAVGYAVTYTDPVPRFVESTQARLRHMPRPGYLGQGGAPSRAGDPPADYTAGRLRFTRPGGAVLPPQNSSAKAYPPGWKGRK
jgi:hypothetical protein